MAAGPVPARSVSASTLLLELEPRPDGMTSTLPRTVSPTCGWCRSMIRPSDGSTPPQNDSGSSSTRVSPEAAPGTRTRVLDAGPELSVTPHPSFHRRAHALLQAAEN